MDSIKSSSSKSKLRTSGKDNRKMTTSMATTFYTRVNSNESLILYNAELANLVDLTVIEPVPRYLNQRKSLEFMNSAFMRACRLNEMAHGDHIDVKLAIKNIAFIADVLEKMSAQISQAKKMLDRW